jgi:hypothetical protein
MVKRLLKKRLLSIIGYSFSIVGILGVILSNAISLIFLFAMTALSGLFTLGVMGQSR